MNKYIFFDTNIVYEDFHFNSVNFQKLLKLNEYDSYNVLITEFNRKEIIKKYLDNIREYVNSFNSSRGKLINYNIDHLDAIRKLKIKTIQEQYSNFLDEYLEENEIEVINIPNGIALYNITNKYFDGIKPFDIGKISFPDAIIWESIRKFSNEIDPEDIIYFISGNSKDFSYKNNNKRLHDDLIKEVPNCIYFNSLEGFLNSEDISKDLSLLTVTTFDMLPSEIKSEISNRIEADKDFIFVDAIETYLSNEELQGEYFSGWGQDIYIEGVDIEFSDIYYDKEDATIYVDYEASVNVSFNITTLNPMYEKDDDDDWQYISEESQKTITIVGTFVYYSEESEYRFNEKKIYS